MNKQDQAYQQAQLLSRYLEGDLNVAEQAEFDLWLTDENNRKLLESLDAHHIQKQLDFYSSIDVKADWEKINSRFPEAPGKKKFKINFVLKYAAIGAFVFLSGAWIVKLNNKQVRISKLSQKRSQIENDIAPGKNKAVLTLADGSKIVLDEKSPNKQSNFKVSRINGKLVYQLLPLSSKEIAYNTISVPTGGQYQFILSDGSKVWLNSLSSLKYPTAFIGRERKVEVNGEAYFEITKDKHMPFKVIANDTEVKVLGTHFNISAYNDEANVNTTLIEGSVQFTAGGKEVMIVPGQEAIFNKNSHKTRVAPADIDQALAWKNGYFLFKNEELGDIMRQLSRWYDVDIEYQAEVPRGHFTGKISRTQHISKIISMLELTGDLHFKIDGRRLLIE